MEFLVAMTTCVPDGTSAAEVSDAVRRERAHSRDLARRGHLRRLWRPPLQPGRRRALGLFVADDEDQLAQVLSSMPGRTWRTDQVTVLGAHPDDPAAQGVVGRPGKGPESLITMTLTVPPGTPEAAVAAARAREVAQIRDLAVHGHLSRFWTLAVAPDGPGTLSLWRARDPGELMAIVESLPLSGWMTIETTPLSPHPNDPIRMH